MEIKPRRRGVACFSVGKALPGGVKGGSNIRSGNAFPGGVANGSNFRSIALIAAIILAVVLPFLGDAVEFIGYTFAGSPLKVGWAEYYNGALIEQKPLQGNISTIFNLTDIKPGDYGRAAITIEARYSSFANVTVVLTPTRNDDVSSNVPELAAGDLPDDPNDPWDGELANNMDFMVWRDINQNGIREPYETLFYSGTAPLSEQAFYLGPMPTFGQQYLGISWSLGSGVGNKVQSDSYTADIKFVVMGYG